MNKPFFNAMYMLIVEIILLILADSYYLARICSTYGGEVQHTFYIHSASYGSTILWITIISSALLAVLTLSDKVEFKKISFLNSISRLGYIVLLIYVIFKIADWEDVYNVSKFNGTKMEYGTGVILILIILAVIAIYDHMIKQARKDI